MISLIKNKIVRIIIILAIAFILLIYDPILFAFDFIVILITSGLWKLSKGKWEKRIKKDEAQKWRKSVVFNLYLFLFMISSLLTSYLWINRPPQISNEPPNILNYIANLNDFSFLFFTFIFIIFCLWKKAPKQILSIPLVSILIILIPGIIDIFVPWELILELYTHIILQLLIIMWAFYIRFIYLVKHTK